MISDKNLTTMSKVMLFICTLIWGSSFFILKNTLNEIPVYFLLCVRFLFSGLLLGLIFIKRWKLLNLKYIWAGGLTGVFLALAYIFQTIGLANTTPGKNAFLTAVYVILVPFMCWVVKKTKPDMFNVAAAVISLVGIGLVCLDGNMSFSFMGEGFTLICGVFFGMQMVAIDIYGKELDIFLFTIIQFFAAFIVCLIFFLCFEKMPTSFSTDSLLSLGYVTVFATTICFIFMNIGIKRTSASYSSLIMCLEAVFGVMFSMIFYHERLTAQIAIGFVIIFIGVIVNETKLSFLTKKSNK